MTLVQKTSQVADGLNRRLQQYKEDKPVLESVLTALLEQIQDLEDATYAIIDARAIAICTGQQLDNLGTIVDLAREGRDDDEYRTLLYVKIGQNTSQGAGEKIISVYKQRYESRF